MEEVADRGVMPTELGFALVKYLFEKIQRELPPKKPARKADYEAHAEWRRQCEQLSSPPAGVRG
jgi:hypothetical protein